MQLVAYGAQDVYLTGNPQITFFKVVYRRHTNFAIEVIEHTLVGEPDFGRRVTAQLGRNADLISKAFLRVVLSSVDPGGSRFAWVRRIGHAFINNIEVEIGGTIMDRQYGVWLDIWFELARHGDHELGYARMVGDVPELTTFNTEVKPEYVLYIPFQFWFNRYVGLAIPMIALQYHRVNINILFNEIDNLVIRDASFDPSGITLNDATLIIDYVYLDSDERRRFAQVGHEYLIEQIQFNGLEQVLDPISRYVLDYNHPTKEIIWAIRRGEFNSNSSFIHYTHLDEWNPEDAAREIILQVSA